MNGHEGIDIREAGTRIIFRAYLADADGGPIATGDARLSLFELGADGALVKFDWYDHTFKAANWTAPVAAMNRQEIAPGMWTLVLTELSAFTSGGIYLVAVHHDEQPGDQWREFQYGRSAPLATKADVHGLTAMVGNIELRLTSPEVIVRAASDAEGSAEIIRGDSYPGIVPFVMTLTGYAGVDPADGTFAFEVISIADYRTGRDGWMEIGGCEVTLADDRLTATITLTPESTKDLSLCPPDSRYNYRYRVRGTVGDVVITPFRGGLTVLG